MAETSGSGVPPTKTLNIASDVNATVSRNMLVLSRSDTAKSEQKIKDWAKGV